MPTLTFDGDQGACALPPFNAVSNQLFFFRVNAFEIDLPIASQSGTSGVIGGFTGKVRLGVPITDLFPHLMPEYGAAFQSVNRLDVRLDRNIFMPASTPNRYYSAGQTAAATSADLDRGSVARRPRPHSTSRRCAGRPLFLASPHARRAAPHSMSRPPINSMPRSTMNYAI